MTAVPKNFGTGGANLTPGGAAGSPDLVTTLRDIADDLAALKPAPIGQADAGAAYTANEQALLNELKATVNKLAAIVLKTTKA